MIIGIVENLVDDRRIALACIKQDKNYFYNCPLYLYNNAKFMIQVANQFGIPDVLEHASERLLQDDLFVEAIKTRMCFDAYARKKEKRTLANLAKKNSNDNLSD